MQPSLELAREVRESWEEALSRRGRVNLLVGGRTGVGKSTLVNAVFQGNFARTGQGRPVTRTTREITKEGIPLTLFDTRGLEMVEYRQTVGELENLIRSRRREVDANRHIHAAWLCISEDLRRVEEAEITLARTLATHIPVVAVITKARSDQGFRDQVLELLPQVRNVVRVRALVEELDDGHVLPPFGLEELVEITNEVVPEGQRNAFAAAQMADISLKKRRAHGVVAASAAAAAAIGATPVPFADAALLIPLEIAMLARITAIFGLPVDEGFLATLVAATLTGVGGTLAGRAIVVNLLKLIPGAGSIAGGTISAATAGSVTTAFGEAYISTLAALMEQGRGEFPSPGQIVEGFRERISGRRSSGTAAEPPLNSPSARS